MQIREFDFISECPGVWLLQAWKLRWTADRLDWLKHSDTPEMFVMSGGVYLFLIGQSIENLLKGILIAHGTPIAESNRTLNKKYSHHRLDAYANEIDKAKLSFSHEDLAILNRLGKYVQWAGRYPMPTRADSFFGVGHSGNDYKAELELFHRLFNHLSTEGWFTMSDGSNVPAANYVLASNLPLPADV